MEKLKPVWTNYKFKTALTAMLHFNKPYADGGRIFSQADRCHSKIFAHLNNIIKNRSTFQSPRSNIINLQPLRAMIRWHQHFIHPYQPGYPQNVLRWKKVSLILDKRQDFSKGFDNSLLLDTFITLTKPSLSWISITTHQPSLLQLKPS